MISAPTKTSYTLKEIVTIFRAVSKQLLANDEILLQSHGIFRLAASEDSINAIVQDCLEAKDISNKDVHEYVDTLKRVLRDRVLIESDSPLVQTFILELSKDDRNEKKAVNNFIQALIDSGNMDNIYLAEIIHTYLHLAQRTSQYSEMNKMTAENLTISPISKFICCNIMNMAPEVFAVKGSGYQFDKVILSKKFAESFDNLYLEQRLEAHNNAIAQTKHDLQNAINFENKNRKIYVENFEKKEHFDKNIKNVEERMKGLKKEESKIFKSKSYKKAKKGSEVVLTNAHNARTLHEDQIMAAKGNIIKSREMGKSYGNALTSLNESAQQLQKRLADAKAALTNFEMIFVDNLSSESEEEKNTYNVEVLFSEKKEQSQKTLSNSVKTVDSLAQILATRNSSDRLVVSLDSSAKKSALSASYSSDEGHENKKENKNPLSQSRI